FAVNEACPLALSATFEANVVPVELSTNVTDPLAAVASLVLITVAVKVTACVVRDGLSDETTVVVVGDPAATVVMFSVHPLSMAPVSPPMSSTTYRFQTPFGFVAP